MAFDTVLLNDGTKVCLFLCASYFVSYQEPIVPDPCVRNRVQMESDCKPRSHLAALVFFFLLYHSCGPRTLQNTWSKPWKPASSTSTQLPVIHSDHFHKTLNQVPASRVPERRERRGWTQREWTCKVIRTVPDFGDGTDHWIGLISTSPPNMLLGMYTNQLQQA